MKHVFVRGSVFDFAEEKRREGEKKKKRNSILGEDGHMSDVAPVRMAAAAAAGEGVTAVDDACGG